MRHQPHQTRFLTSTNERYCRIWSFLRFPATTNRSDPFCTVFPKGSSEPQLTRQGEVVVSGADVLFQMIDHRAKTELKPTHRMIAATSERRETEVLQL
jgi:hypothetical protein